MSDLSDSSELLRRGREVLIRELGFDDAERFLSLCRQGLAPTGQAGTVVVLEAPSRDVGTRPGSEGADAPVHVDRETHRPGGVEAKRETQLEFFDADVQPWTPAPVVEVTPENEEKRRALLAGLAESHLGTVENKVADILQRFPETRDSDTALAIRYWRRFEADVLEQFPDTDLDVLYGLQAIDTVTRSRRHIQNELCLYQGSPRTRTLRGDLQRQFHQYVAEKRLEDPETRFYLDETGNEPEFRLTGVAGICALDWRQYEKYHAALTQWRTRRGWLETIHFADLGKGNEHRATALLDQLRRRRSGLLFVGCSIPSRGPTHKYLASLFVQLVVDSLKHAQEQKFLTAPRAVSVFKEADEGFDKFYLPLLKEELAEQLAREFRDAFYLRDVRPVPKGREVLLECADSVAASIQRRRLRGGRDRKDVFAEAVFNLTGFEDPEEVGAVYRVF